MMYIIVHTSECLFLLFKQKTAYEMRISDWSSDVCSSDLLREVMAEAGTVDERLARVVRNIATNMVAEVCSVYLLRNDDLELYATEGLNPDAVHKTRLKVGERSEEHTSELQSLMRISYAVFCLKKKKT